MAEHDRGHVPIRIRKLAVTVVSIIASNKFKGGVTVVENSGSKKPYEGPTLEKCENIVEITEVSAIVSGVATAPGD